MKKSNKALPIAELLPDGLTDGAISEIAELVNTAITEQVEERVHELEIKVKGFMRLKIDQLKEQAIVELQETEQFVRNAKLFESVKTLMALELSSEDEDSAIASLAEDQGNLESEIEVLTDELRKSFEINEQLEAAFDIVTSKIHRLEEDNEVLSSSVESLRESEGRPFHSSEKALVIAENVDKSSKKLEAVPNDFLTPEVMKYMPSNLNSK